MESLKLLSHQLITEKRGPQSKFGTIKVDINSDEDKFQSFHTPTKHQPTLLNVLWPLDTKR